MLNATTGRSSALNRHKPLNYSSIRANCVEAHPASIQGDGSRWLLFFLYFHRDNSCHSSGPRLWQQSIVGERLSARDVTFLPSLRSSLEFAPNFWTFWVGNGRLNADGVRKTISMPLPTVGVLADRPYSDAFYPFKTKKLSDEAFGREAFPLVQYLLILLYEPRVSTLLIRGIKAHQVL